MVKLKKIIFLSALLFVTGARLAFAGCEDAVFEIPAGSTGRAVAERLKADGFIKSENYFLGLLKIFFDTNTIKAGEYNLNKCMNSYQILSCIKTGACIYYRKVTIPEGWRMEETAARIAAAGVTDEAAFLKLARERDLEGYLFPSTYNFTKNMPPEKVIELMLGEFEKNMRPLFNAADLKLTEKQILTLASIIEREALVHDERSKISAVYHNRLKIKHALQADPTVQYALGYNKKEDRWWKKTVTYADLLVKSPYNTYANKGLPPGPIASPSAASVGAALYPEQDFSAMFFVADNESGRHIFSRTYTEHLRNIKSVKAK